MQSERETGKKFIIIVLLETKKVIGKLIKKDYISLFTEKQTIYTEEILPKMLLLEKNLLGLEALQKKEKEVIKLLNSLQWSNIR